MADPIYSTRLRKRNAAGRFARSRRVDVQAMRVAYESGLSFGQCGSRFGISWSLVRLRLLEVGVVPRPNVTPADIDDRELRTTYESGRDLNECARLFGVQNRTIARRLQILGILQRLNYRKGRNRKSLDRADLRRLYVEEERSMEECSGLLGVSVGIVWRCLRDFDLPVRPQGGRIGKNSPIHDGVLPNDKVAYSKIWRKKNRARLREYQVDYLANHPNRDGLILHYRMSTMVRYTLKRGQGKNRRAWLTMVPYTIEELKAHLLTTIPPDHTWADFVSGELEIDHKIPQSVFHFSSPADQDFQRCWALENLQLLPSIANKSKGNRLSAPFQPTLL